MTDVRGALEGGLADLGVAADAAAVDRLIAYLALLQRWSAAYNLVGTSDAGELVGRHLLDCAALLPHLPEGSLLDIGSGAGLPGLVIACLEPERPLVLLDSVSRKTRFLTQARIELGLTRVEVVTARVEDYAASLASAEEPAALPAAVVARALAPMDRLAAMSAALLEEGCELLAMKGPGWEQEVAELDPGRWRIEAHPYRLAAADRDYVILRVLRRTA